MTNYLYFEFYIYFFVANVSLAFKFWTTISSLTLKNVIARKNEIKYMNYFSNSNDNTKFGIYWLE